jgi:hypothetical protein
MSLVRYRYTSVVVGMMGALAAVSPASPVNATSAVPHCQSHQLTVSEGAGGAGLGHVGYPIRLRNRSQATCSVHGYPGVAGLNKHGKQVEQALRTKSGYLGGVKPGHPIPTVILQPHQVASALVEGTDVPSGHQKHCRELHGLLVTPPNDHKAIHLNHAPPDCSRIEVHPVVRGKSGTQSR